MNKLLLSFALGGAVLGLAGCKSEPAPAPAEVSTDQAAEAAAAPSDEPSAPNASEASDDGQGGPINRPPTTN